MGIYSKKTRLIKETMKNFNPKYEGYFMLQCCLDKLTEDFMKYSRKIMTVLFVETAEVFKTTIKAVERNIRYLMTHSGDKYKNYKLKDFLLELSIELLVKLEGGKYKEDE